METQNDSNSNSESVFSTLEKCLLDQHENYLRICEVLETERRSLIFADIQALIENNKLKEALLGRSKTLEKSRLIITDNLLITLNIQSPTKMISDIIPKLPKEMGKSLIAVQANLTFVLGQIRRLNDQNEKLISSARHVIDSGLQALRGESPENKTYRKQGKLKANKSAGAIVSKEV